MVSCWAAAWPGKDFCLQTYKRDRSDESPGELPGTPGSPSITALDENYWNQVRKTYQANTEFINFNNTNYAQREWWAHYLSLHQQVAEFLNLEPDEVVLTRGATEALQALITGYNG